MRSHVRLLIFISALICVFIFMDAYGVTSASAQDEANAESLLSGEEVELVNVDWMEEMREGGMTMVALLLLSVIGVAITIERAIMVRRKRFSPPGLLGRVLPMIRSDKHAAAAELCRKQHSILGQTILFVLEHRNNSMEKVAEAASDLAGRCVADQEQRTYPLAAVAALAPLLGLLGTMIGMIESFKLVEVFGDEGGASMLAGSISKALITTAVGLIIAIPTLALYHVFRQRIHKHAMELENDVQTLINEMYLEKSPVVIEKPRTPQKPQPKVRQVV